MARLVLFVAFVILSLHNSIAQPVSYPELKLVRHSLSGSSFFNRFVVMTFDLELTDGQKKVYDEKMQEVRDFVKKFEEEKEKLEREYNASSGEARIQKARALLNFVMRSEQAWQEFTLEMGKEWKGIYNCDFNLFGIVRITGKGDAKISLTGGGAASLNANTLTGTIDESATVSMNFHSAAVGSGHYTGKGELNGTSHAGKTWLTKYNPDYKSLDGELALAGPWPLASYSVTKNGITTGYVDAGRLGYGQYKSDETHTSGYYVIYDFLAGMYVRHDYNESRPPPGDFYFLFEYSDPLIENINFQELKDKYFRFYINDINKVRLHQYNAGALEEKARLGEATLRELSSAQSYGQVIGVSGSVFQELMLLYQTKGSLYDDWFRLWFRPSDEIWQKKIQGSGSENTLASLEGRVKNAIEAIARGQMIASDELMQDLQLVPKSDFMTGIIRDYFVKGNEVRCASRLANTITDEQFRQWKLQVYKAAVVYASDGVANMVANSNCPSQ